MAISEARQRVIQLTNQARKRHGLRALVGTSILNRSAQVKARYLARTDRLEHGPRWWMVIYKLGGKKYGWVAENIGYDSTADDVHDRWMNSTLHVQNVLNPKAYVMGAGRARSKKSGRVYWVQHFGGKG